MSRLKEGTTSSAAKRQCATYNAFGAITGLATSTGTCTPSPISVSASTNRLNHIPGSLEYDTAGNMTKWYNGTLRYDWYQSNQMRRFEDTTSPTRVNFFGYTADGERIAHFDSVSPTGITYTIRGLDGKVLREYNEAGGSWTWKKDWIYRDGQHAAVIDSGGIKHLHLDHLGAIRRITSSTGSLLVSHDYYPFGQEATSAYADTERMKYTGHERDLRKTTTTTDDLDYMHARYYNPNLARFLSVDPGRDNTPDAPQSWNLYSYVRNNPTTAVDPTGLYGVDVHLYLTALLALEAGRSGDEAFTIAMADQGVDESRGAGLSSAIFNRADFELHFMDTAAALASVATAGSWGKLGESLHSLQDSYSHAGFHWPFGHLFATMFGRDPDNPARTAQSQRTAMDMAVATFAALGGDPSRLNRTWLSELLSVKSKRQRLAWLKSALRPELVARLGAWKPKRLVKVTSEADPFRGTGFVSADNVQH